MDVFGLVLFSTLTFSTPLILAALGGMFSERSGVVNIGLEGMMTFGAFAGSTFIVLTEQSLGIFAILLGVLIAMFFGALIAYGHAIVSIKYKIDQIISGTVINIAALGTALYLCGVIFQSGETPSKVTRGISFFDGKLELITIVAFLLIIVSAFLINKTKWGMHVRAVGENPQAADAMGINVLKVRYQAVVLSGILAGLGGISIVLTTTSNFAGSVVAGQGFIALAVLIFGRWKPKGILLAGLLFGFCSTLGTVVVILLPDLPIAPIYFQILPYVVTIFALVIFSRKSIAPSALGKPYDKEMR